MTARADLILPRLRSLTAISPLVPKKVLDAALTPEIEALTAAPALKAALHLWNDDLDRCHTIAQDLPSADGSYLHGVMHRREPDYGNSKYWFHRVGVHAAFPDVRKAALEVLSGDLRKAVEKDPAWDPFRMVDWCERAARDPELEAVLRVLQRREIEILAAWLSK